MQRSFSFIFCNAFFHFRYYSLYFARLVASLLQESLYKRQMIHIHVRSTGSSHVRTWCWCEKIKTEIWHKKKSVNHCGVFQCSRLEWPHEITTWWGCEKATTPQYGSQVSTYEPWSNTDAHKNKTILIKSESCTLFFTKGFKHHFKEVLCSLDIQTDEPNSGFRGNDGRSVGWWETFLKLQRLNSPLHLLPYVLHDTRRGRERTDP